MVISGVVKEILRENHLPPKDGVHRASSKDGYIKGARSMILNDETLLPRGMTGFYYQHKEDKGIKIFWSAHHNRCCKKRTVAKQFRKHWKLYELGIASKPYKMVQVELNFDYYDKKGRRVRRVHCWPWGIVQEHVHYPKGAWTDYAGGKPYDWNCLDQKEHPLHNPKGYHKFAKWMKPLLLKHKIYVCGNYPVKEKDPPKLGDVVYNTKKKRWQLVDVG